VTIAGTAIYRRLGSDKLRRQHIGFIFQFFNLPMLTAEGILLQLSIAGVKPDRGGSTS
jgi:putative ABC transport system ATP-binding protein